MQTLPHSPMHWETSTHFDRGRYYVARDGASDYAGYWGEVRDPDGKLRRRADERAQFVEDVAEEMDFLASLAPGRILDIGCGLGWLLQSMPAGWDLCGTELSPEAVTACEAAGIKMLDPSLRCPDFYGQFDVIVMHHVIEHMPRPEWAIRQVYRLLRSGGHLVMATPDFFSPCAMRFGANYRLLHDRTHISLFSNESAHRFLADHGFNILRVSYPFPQRYATPETFARWHDTSKVSPPWPGNFITFYAEKG